MSEQERRIRITIIGNTLLEIEKAGKKIVFEEFISQIMGRWCVSRRTAKEYLETAKILVNPKQENEKQNKDSKETQYLL